MSRSRPAKKAKTSSDGGARSTGPKMTYESKDAMRTAMNNSDVNRIRELLSSNTYSANAKAEFGAEHTLLKFAAKKDTKNRLQIVELLLEHGADVDHQSYNWSKEFGETALSKACASGREKIVHVLLRWGADVTRDSPLVRLAMSAAVEKRHLATARLLLRHERAAEMLAATCRRGGTALDHACAHGHRDLVELLWPHGAQMHQAEETMARVCSNKDTSVLDFLLQHKPALLRTKVEEPNTAGDEEEKRAMPMLHLAAKLGNHTVVRILSMHMRKSDTDRECLSLDAHGNTPLHLAATEAVAVYLFHQTGHNHLKRTNEKGQTPLECARERLQYMPQETPRPTFEKIFGPNYKDILGPSIFGPTCTETAYEETKKVIDFFEKEQGVHRRRPPSDM